MFCPYRTASSVYQKTPIDFSVRTRTSVKRRTYGFLCHPFIPPKIVLLSFISPSTSSQNTPLSKHHESAFVIEGNHIDSSTSEARTRAIFSISLPSNPSTPQSRFIFIISVTSLSAQEPKLVLELIFFHKFSSCPSMRLSIPIQHWLMNFY